MLRLWRSRNPKVDAHQPFHTSVFPESGVSFSKGKSDEETAAAGVEALADFIKEMGLPTSFHEMGIDPGTDFEAIANSANISTGCCKRLTHEEILAIFNECR